MIYQLCDFGKVWISLSVIFFSLKMRVTLDTPQCSFMELMRVFIWQYVGLTFQSILKLKINQ